VSSSERVRQLPAEWLDRLLVAYCQVRADTPIEEAVAQLLAVGRELLDDAALGVCIPRSALPLSSERFSDRARIGGQARDPQGGQVVIRLAPSRSSHPVESAPTRLFPELGG